MRHLVCRCAEQRLVCCVPSLLNLSYKWSRGEFDLESLSCLPSPPTSSTDSAFECSGRRTQAQQDVRSSSPRSSQSHTVQTETARPRATLDHPNGCPHSGKEPHFPSPAEAGQATHSKKSETTIDGSWGNSLSCPGLGGFSSGMSRLSGRLVFRAALCSCFALITSVVLFTVCAVRLPVRVPSRLSWVVFLAPTRKLAFPSFFFRRYPLRCSLHQKPRVGGPPGCVRRDGSDGWLSPVPRGDNTGGRVRVPPPPIIPCRPVTYIAMLCGRCTSWPVLNVLTGPNFLR